MLSNARVMAVIPVTDLDRARDFYENILELEVAREISEQGAVVYQANGTNLLVYQRATASSGEHTVASFQVGDDFNEVVNGLIARGVTFDTFEIPGVDLPWDDRGVLVTDQMSNGWFKDPDGNVLAIGTTI